MKMYVVEFYDEDIEEVYYSYDKAIREVVKRYLNNCYDFFYGCPVKVMVPNIEEDLHHIITDGYVEDFVCVHEVTVMDEPIMEETENG